MVVDDPCQGRLVSHCTGPRRGRLGWEGRQLTQTGHRDVPCQTPSCSARKTGGRGLLSFFPYVALIFFIFFFLNTFIYNETVHHCETAPEVIALLLDFSLGASKKDEFGKTHYRAQHEDKECDVNKFKQQRRRLIKRIPEWLRLEQISGDSLLIQPLPMIHCIFINVWKLEV